MRKILSISLSILLLASCCKDIGTYINFYANQDFIAKVLCINKDDVKSCCAGKCYLTKKLANGKSDKDNPSPVTQSDIKQLLYIPVITEALLTHIDGEFYTHHYHYDGISPKEVRSNLFRPPIVS